MSLKIYENPCIDELNIKAFISFKNIIETISKNQNHIVIALSGGTSVSGIYEQIKCRYNELTPHLWKKIIFCFADERVVPLTSPESNYKFAKDSFLSLLVESNVITENQIIKIAPNCDNPHIVYENELKHNVDIALLGVGPDAHTCSLFPNHSSIENNSNSFILVTDSPKPPPKRVSLSKSMLANINYTFTFFIGENKRKAYTKFLDKNLSEKEVPIKIIKNCKNSIVFTNLV